jgi:hypothetical protein
MLVARAKQEPGAAASGLPKLLKRGSGCLLAAGACQQGRRILDFRSLAEGSI